MKSYYANEYKPGEKAITAKGEIVTVDHIVSDRYVVIKEKLDKKVYIPSHGEIKKL